MNTSATTANSICDQADGANIAPPIVNTFAGSTLAAANELAESSEHFNAEPFGYWEEHGDSMWGLPMYVDAIFHALQFTTPTAGSLVGMGIGSMITAPGLGGNLNAVRISLRYKGDTAHWELEVCNKWAAAGHKQKLIDLGTNPAGIPNTTGIARRLEMMYYPNQMVQAFINGFLVYTFTDAQDGGGDTPLLDIFNNAHSVGSTIRGMAIFTSTGTGAGKTRAYWDAMYAETIVPR
jgi:hypothetical protein